MKIPKKLKIGCHVFRLEIKELDEAQGQTNRYENLIEIDSRYPQDQQEATLIHEIFHACNSTMSHEFLDSLSAQLYQVLKENKLLR